MFAAEAPLSYDHIKLAVDLPRIADERRKSQIDDKVQYLDVMRSQHSDHEILDVGNQASLLYSILT